MEKNVLIINDHIIRWHEGEKWDFFSLEIITKKRKKIHREHTCAFCAFSTSVINILRFVECSRSVLSKTSGHLFLSELEFIRMSLISVLEMLEWLQFYFIALAKMLAAPFCLPGQRKKDLHVQWIKEKRPLIFIFVIFTEDYKINAELQEEPGLLMAQITPPESEVFEIHTRGDCQNSWVKDFQIVKAFWEPQDRTASSEETSTPKMDFNKVSTLKSMAFILLSK